ncbi:hypothetical protein LENED_010847 [Lentinula edodes]|uniref:Uncharacterized protein n=1 Tax=Lentinula edodes TaxID=5353 RepID=A0A1Q3ENU0_LENED|nr:hypothetical protein LENED_010847 [Lentinula edodes]
MILTALRTIAPLRRYKYCLLIALKYYFYSRARPVGEDPDDGDDGDADDDEDEEDREPCERCKVKKIPSQKQAGKRSSVICKPCHDSKVRCLYSGRPFTVKKEGGAGLSGERLAVLESQMAQVLADNRALRESASRSHQYLRQLLRRQDEDHSRLIAIDIRLGPLGAISAAPGPSRVVVERLRSLKRRRIVENSDEEEEEEKGKELETEKEVEEDGKGEVEEEGGGMVEKETAPIAAQSEKGKERAEE